MDRVARKRSKKQDTAASVSGSLTTFLPLILYPVGTLPVQGSCRSFLEANTALIRSLVRSASSWATLSMMLIFRRPEAVEVS